MGQVQCIIIMLSFGLSIITNQTDLKESTYQAEKPVIDQLWQECSLPLEEWPDYYYFINEGHGSYRLDLEDASAFVVKEYTMDSGLENEVWELKRIYSCGDTNAYLAYVESKTKDELYILFSDGPGAQPVYIILADIRKDANADVSLPYGGYAYNSMLEWYSYKEWFDGTADGPNIHYKTIGEIYDSVYDSGLYFTIKDYANRTDRDTESQWEVHGNDVYVGGNRYIACAVCQNESHYFIFLFDVSNKVYAVMEL